MEARGANNRGTLIDDSQVSLILSRMSSHEGAVPDGGGASNGVQGGRGPKRAKVDTSEPVVMTGREEFKDAGVEMNREERRAQQLRDAQKAYRQRKNEKARGLEEKLEAAMGRISELEDRLSMQNESGNCYNCARNVDVIDQLKYQVDQLHFENEHLRKLSASSTVTHAPLHYGPPPPSLTSYRTNPSNPSNNSMSYPPTSSSISRDPSFSLDTPHDRDNSPSAFVVMARNQLPPIQSFIKPIIQPQSVSVSRTSSPAVSPPLPMNSRHGSFGGSFHSGTPYALSGAISHRPLSPQLSGVHMSSAVSPGLATPGFSPPDEHREDSHVEGNEVHGILHRAEQAREELKNVPSLRSCSHVDGMIDMFKEMVIYPGKSKQDMAKMLNHRYRMLASCSVMDTHKALEVMEQYVSFYQMVAAAQASTSSTSSPPNWRLIELSEGESSSSQSSSLSSLSSLSLPALPSSSDAAQESTPIQIPLPEYSPFYDAVKLIPSLQPHMDLVNQFRSLFFALAIEKEKVARQDLYFQFVEMSQRLSGLCNEEDRTKFLLAIELGRTSYKGTVDALVRATELDFSQ
ncbi:hypothetical protein BJ741DRAFT_604029 [Chytriomyces cf. hyalinus JEL632]|nr:hypothetical protein BJ741DRAFT_604029 [Chytriomyces cf. hyalinus JEL632]